jgi:hypothetical protein
MLSSHLYRFSFADEKHFPDSPVLEYGNGDGTVNIRSLRGCLRWTAAAEQLQEGKKSSSNEGNSSSKPLSKLAELSLVKRARSSQKRGGFLEMKRGVHVAGNTPGKYPKRVFHEEYSGVNHMQILRDKGVIQYIRDAVGRMNAN